MDNEAKFDADAALAAQPARELGAKLGGFSALELEAMLEAEMAGKNRTSVREVLQAEIGARQVPLRLPPEAVVVIAEAADEVVALHFLESGDTVGFTVEPDPAHFAVDGRKLRYLREVRLAADKKRVSIVAIAAMNAAGQVIDTCRLTMPLQGGGGRSAKFPGGSIAFHVPADNPPAPAA